MNIKSKSYKKIVKFLLALTLIVGVANVAYAERYGDSMNGASNYEVGQVQYNGAAWNYSGSGYNWASFTYTRNGQTLLKRTAKKGKVTGSVWDDLVRWGKNYTTKFYWNHG